VTGSHRAAISPKRWRRSEVSLIAATASESVLPDPVLWDLWAVARSHEMVETWVPNYHDLGRTDLTATELRNRHTSWTEHLLAKIAASS
jgi:hypothetical protein